MRALTRDEAMRADRQAGDGAGGAGAASAGGDLVLRVDGGMVASDWTMQTLADVLGAPVDRPHVLETTALGAAWLAGQHAGVCAGQDEFARGWSRERRFMPAAAPGVVARRYAGWKRAVAATLAFADT